MAEVAFSQAMAQAAKNVTDPLTAVLGNSGRRFVMHWGEMGWRWGVNRTVAQLHALLFLLGRPMHAEETADMLNLESATLAKLAKLGAKVQALVRRKTS